MPLLTGDTVTSLAVVVATAGAGTPPSHIWLALYDVTGHLLGQTADLAASGIWTAGNQIAQANLQAPVTIPATGGYYPAFLEIGAFGTTALRLANANAAAFQTDPAIGGAQPCVVQGGQAGLPNPAIFSPDPGIRPWFGWA